MGIRESFELGGKVALITGGSRGLGLQIARGLGEMGALVAISARKAHELAEARATLEAIGVDVVTVTSDLSKADEVPRLVDAVLEQTGRIDILVNNAGASWGAPAEDHPLDAWDKVMTLNTSRVFQLSQEVAKRCLIPQRHGTIINVASIAGLRIEAQMQSAAYFTSKAATVHLTRALAVEWGKYGIRVNAICPGFFPSKMTAALLDTIEADIVARTPLGRLGGDDDLHGVVALLASEAARHITGQAIAIDGGQSLA